MSGKMIDIKEIWNTTKSVNEIYKEVIANRVNMGNKNGEEK